LAETSNAGASWHGQKRRATGDIAGIACPSVKVCFAVTSDDGIIGTYDGGTTWRIIQKSDSCTGPGCPRGAYFGIACSTSTACVAAGNVLADKGGSSAVVDFTTDGWRTVHAANVSDSVAALSAACIGSSRCYVYTDRQEVLVRGGRATVRKLSGPGPWTGGQDPPVALARPGAAVCYALMSNIDSGEDQIWKRSDMP